jgi:hypothetical protein
MRHVVHRAFTSTEDKIYCRWRSQNAMLVMALAQPRADARSARGDYLSTPNVTSLWSLRYVQTRRIERGYYPPQNRAVQNETNERSPHVSVSLFLTPFPLVGSRRAVVDAAPVSTIAPRAKAIVTGLVRTGRATKFQVVGEFVRADGIGTAIYWVTSDGTRVLRGDVPHSADELQAGFIEKMLRAGSGA